jgi:hypothetical protein
MSNGQKIVLKIFGETTETLNTFIKTTLDSYTFFCSKIKENDREDQGKYFVWVTILTPAPTDKADAGAKSTLPQIPLECV